MSWARVSYRVYEIAQKAIIPELKHAQESYCEKLKAIFPERARWLDLGCGHQVFGDWMLDQERELAARSGRFVGLDLNVESLRRHRTLRRGVIGDGEALPFRQGSFDIVTANMVAEHLERPEAVIGEVCRVLRPGGSFVVHTPNRKYYKIRVASKLPQELKNAIIWFLERRKEEDIVPTVYRFNTTAAIKRCAAECGVRVEELHLVQSTTSLWRLGPIVLVDLLLLRLFRRPRFRELRSNIIVCLTKERVGTE